MIGQIQKISLAILLWLLIYVFTWIVTFNIVWPQDVLLAGRKNHTIGVDGGHLALPAIAWVAIYAIPSIIVGSLAYLYRLGRRNQK